MHQRHAKQAVHTAETCDTSKYIFPAEDFHTTALLFSRLSLSSLGSCVICTPNRKGGSHRRSMRHLQVSAFLVLVIPVGWVGQRLDPVSIARQTGGSHRRSMPHIQVSAILVLVGCVVLHLDHAPVARHTRSLHHRSMRHFQVHVQEQEVTVHRSKTLLIASKLNLIFAFVPRLCLLSSPASQLRIVSASAGAMATGYRF